MKTTTMIALLLCLITPAYADRDEHDDGDHDRDSSLDRGYLINISASQSSVKTGDKITFSGQVSWGNFNKFDWDDHAHFPSNRVQASQIHVFFPDYLTEISSSVNLNSKNLKFSYVTPPIKNTDQNVFIIQVGDSPKDVKELQITKSKLDQKADLLQNLLAHAKQKNFCDSDIQFLKNLIALVQNASAKIQWFLTQNNSILALRQVPLQVDNQTSLPSVVQATYGGFVLNVTANPGAPIEGQTVALTSKVTNIRGLLTDRDWDAFDHKNTNWVINYNWQETRVGQDQISTTSPLTTTFNYTASKIHPSSEDMFQVILNYKQKRWSDTLANISLFVPVTKDSTPPVWTNVMPDSAHAYVQSMQPIQGALVDAFGSVDPSSIVVKLNGQDITSTLSISTLDGGASYLISGSSQNLAEGAYTFTLNGSDMAGNHASQYTANFKVDHTPPVITLGVQDGILTNNPSLSIPVTITDASPTSTTVILNGVALPVTAGIAFNASFVLVEGLNTFEVSSQDAAGNVSFVNLQNIVLDTTPPTLSNLSPGDNAVLTSTTFTVSGSTNEVIGHAKVNGNDLTLSADKKSFSGTYVSQVMGTFLLHLEVSDLLGNLTKKDISVSIASNPLIASLITVIPDPDNAHVDVIGAPGASIPGILISVNAGFFNNGSVTSNSDGSFKVSLYGFQDATVTATNPATNQTASATVHWGSSTTLLSGTVKDTNQNPLPGATVSILNTTVPPVITDANGVFLFTQLVTGDQQLQIDGSTVTIPAPDGSPRKFSKTVLSISIGYTQSNVLQRPIYLSPIPLDGSAKVVTASAGGNVTSPNAPGATLSIPSGSAVFPDGATSANIAITKISADVSTVPVVEYAKPKSLYALEPSGTQFLEPVDLTLPNDSHLPAGSQAVVMSMNSTTGQWTLDGVGQVDSSGQNITTLPGQGITHFSAVYYAPIMNAPLSINGNGNDSSAILSKTVSLPSYKIMGSTVTPKILYNSSWGRPSVFLSNLVDLTQSKVQRNIDDHGTVTFTTYNCFLFLCDYQKQPAFWSSNIQSTSTYKPTQISAQFSSEQIQTPEMSIVGNPYLPERSVVSYLLHLQDPASGQFMASGVHDYWGKYKMYLDEITVGTQTLSVWTNANTAPQVTTTDFANTNSLQNAFPTDLHGTLLLDNETQSPVGVGWRMGGVQKIADVKANRIMIEEEDGSASQFEINNSANPIATNIGGQLVPNCPVGQTCPVQAYVTAANVSQWPYLVSPQGSFSTNSTGGQTETVKLVRTDLTTGQQTVLADISSYDSNSLNPNGVPYRVSSVIDTLGIVQHWTYNNSMSLPDGTTYLSTSDGYIIKVAPDGTETTVVGSERTGGAATPKNAILNNPTAIIAGGQNNTIVFCDTGNNRVMLANFNNNTISTIAGNGLSLNVDVGDGGYAVYASLNHPQAIAYDINFNLYIATANGIIRKVDQRGIITTFAGSYTGYLADTTPASKALFSNPKGLVFDNTHRYLYVSDSGNNRIVRIDMFSMSANTVAGTNQSGSKIGLTALQTQLNAPTDLFFDPNLNLTAIDSGNQQVKNVIFGDLYLFGNAVGPASYTLSTASNPGVRQNTDGTWVPFLQRNLDHTFTRNFRNGSSVSFNATGREILAQDNIGNNVYFSYDTSGNLTQITHPNGQVITFNYSGNSLSSITDPAGRTTRLSFDGDHNLSQVTFSDGSSKAFSYQAPGLMNAESNENAQVTNYTYNQFERINSVTLPNGKVSLAADSASTSAVSSTGVSQANTYGLNAGNAMDGAMDPNGNTTAYAKDFRGFIETVSDPLGNRTEITNDAFGRPLTTIFPDGSKATYTYNSWGDQISSAVSMGITTSQTFDAHGNMLTSVNGRGGTTRYQYWYQLGGGNIGQLIYSKTDPFGHTTFYTYNSFGQIVRVLDPSFAITRYGYDSLGNQTSIIDPLNHTISKTFDLAGNITSITDQNGKTTIYTYDAFNRIISVTTPAQKTTAYSYFPGGQLQAVQDPSGNVTSYTYDSLGNTLSKTDPLGFATYFSYDDGGRLVSQTDANGAVTTYQYDAASNMVQKNAPEKSTVYNYDFRKNLVQITDPLGREIFNYDQAGRFTGAQQVWTGANIPNQNITYTLNKNGARINMNDGLYSNSYTRDTIDRPVFVQDSYGNYTQFTYNDSNRSMSLIRNGVVYSNYQMNANWMVSGINHRDSSLNTISSYSLIRDNVGNLIQISGSTQLAQINRSIAYDNNYQVASATNSEAKSSQTQNETFSYDSDFNRTTDTGGSYTYDSKSQRLVGDYRYNYFYDNNGNLIKKVSVNSFQDFINYTYNSSNQLTQIDTYAPGSFSPIKSVSYLYDQMGRRAQKVVNDTSAPSDVSKTFTRRYAYDGQEILYEFDSSNNPLVRYTHSTRKTDEALMVTVFQAGVNAKMAQNQGTYFYMKDANGSTSDIADLGGNFIQHYVYSAFGMLLGIQDANGADITSSPLVNTSFGFTGREHDSESGLMYYRARYYDPSIGRFLQEDSDPGSLSSVASVINKYAYVANNPFNFTDPTGMFSVGDLWNGIKGSIAGFVLFGLLGQIGGFIGGLTGAISESTINKALVVEAIVGASFVTGGIVGPTFGALAGGVVGGAIGGTFHEQLGFSSWGAGFWFGFGIGSAAGGIGGNIGKSAADVARDPASASKRSYMGNDYIKRTSVLVPSDPGEDWFKLGMAIENVLLSTPTPTPVPAPIHGYAPFP